jgi:hypothetical protein
MARQIIVQIIGSQIACSEGLQDSWRELAEYTRRQLELRFNSGCRVEYFDLFDPACPPLPAEAQLPFVMIAGEKFSSGGKLNIPGISKRVADLLDREE